MRHPGPPLAQQHRFLIYPGWRGWSVGDGARLWGVLVDHYLDVGVGEVDEPDPDRFGDPVQTHIADPREGLGDLVAAGSTESGAGLSRRFAAHSLRAALRAVLGPHITDRARVIPRPLHIKFTVRTASRVETCLEAICRHLSLQHPAPASSVKALRLTL